MRINKKQFDTWIKALRSGKYSQTQFVLQDQHGFCCLGVGCDVLIPKSLVSLSYDGYIHGSFAEAQRHAPKWLKEIDNNFSHLTLSSLSILNDAHGFTFDEIADVLEAAYVWKVLE